MKKSVTLLCFLSIFCSYFSLANLQATTLNEAITDLYKNNQKLKAESQKVKESQANFASSVLSIAPDIRYSENLDQETTITSTAGLVFKPKYPKTRTTSLNREFSLSNTIMNPTIAKKSIDLGKENFRKNEQIILLEAISSYLNALKQEEVLKITEENLEIARKTVKLIETQFNLGDTTKTKLEYAMSDLSSRQSVKIRAEGALINALANYQKTFGINAKNLSFPNKLPKIPDQFKQFQEIARQENPDIEIANLNQKIYKYNVTNTASNLLPTVGVSYRKTKNDAFFEFEDKVKIREEYGVSLNIPILPQGGAEYAKVISAKYRFNQAQAMYYYTYSELNEQILSAWENIYVSKANLEAATAAQKSAKAAMDAMRTEYEYGTVSVLELLESEKQYFDTSINLINAKYSNVLVYYQLLAIMGRLNKSTFGC